MFAQMQAVDWSGMTGSLLILTVLVAGLIGGWVVLRRWFFAPQDEPASTWDLQQLRELRDRGELSVAQYERLRSGSIAAMTTGPTSVGSGHAYGRSEDSSIAAPGISAVCLGDMDARADGAGAEGAGDGGGED